LYGANLCVRPRKESVVLNHLCIDRGCVGGHMVIIRNPFIRILDFMTTARAALTHISTELVNKPFRDTLKVVGVAARKLCATSACIDLIEAYGTHCVHETHAAYYSILRLKLRQVRSPIDSTMADYTHFQEFNGRASKAGNAVSACLYHLLRHGDSSKMNDAHLEELYDEWRAHLRALDAVCRASWHTDAPMPRMPPNNAEHAVCRQMVAVNIERLMHGEGTAQEYLPAVIGRIKETHRDAIPPFCSCKQTTGWTYANLDALNALWESLKPAPPTPAPSNPNITNLLNTAMEAENAIAEAKAMPGGSTEDGFLKNLFKTVQGVNYDDKCPHALPFYACMSCSH
jgi:hypothetical protein